MKMYVPNKSNRKLSKREVVNIRSKHRIGVTTSRLARDNNVSMTTILNIVSRKTYREF